MPLITAKTSVEISKEKEIALKEKFGEVISLIGKSESWLMVDFQDKKKLWFKGTDEDCGIIEIDLFGKASDEGYDALTEKITEIVCSELPIDRSRLYVKYNEIDHWGYSGFNF